MEELDPATSDDAVLAFLQAEIETGERDSFFTNSLSQHGYDRSVLIDNADLSDARANRARAAILGAYRGYGRNEILFTGFPNDTKWRRVLIDLDEIGRLKYVGTESFAKLSNGTRLVGDGARNYKCNAHTAKKVDVILKKLSCGVSFPELVLVEDANNSDLVIIEGNHRATAYVIDARATKFSALIGTSPAMQHWLFFKVR